MREEAKKNKKRTIALAKELLLDITCISDCPDEMKALDSFLERIWHFGWLVDRDSDDEFIETVLDRFFCGFGANDVALKAREEAFFAILFSKMKKYGYPIPDLARLFQEADYDHCDDLPF